jgi:hypothetical protein
MTAGGGRQENHDGLSTLMDSLDHYMEKIAQSNSEALIETSNDVIRDFNIKIREQFGDTLEQLHAAVEKLVVRQENYRRQMTDERHPSGGGRPPDRPQQPLLMLTPSMANSCYGCSIIDSARRPVVLGRLPASGAASRRPGRRLPA